MEPIVFTSELALAGLTILASLVVLLTVIVIRQHRRLQQNNQSENELQYRYQLTESKLAEVSNELTQFKSQNQSLQSNHNVLQQNVATLRAEKQALQERLTERDAEIAELKLINRSQHQNFVELQESHRQLGNELTELKTSLAEKQQHFEQQKQDIAEQKQMLKVEFSNLANQILEEKGKSFSQSNKSELDAILKPFKEQVEGFQKRVNEVHSESIKGQAGLAAELRKVLDVGAQMSEEANNLAKALKGDKKTAGNWGEIQLERTLQLAGLIKGAHYESQDSYVDQTGQRRLPDFVIKLPDNKHIIIDSKVSLVAYDAAVAATTEVELINALDAHVLAVKNHIDDLYKKDYSNLVGIKSPSFVLMFMPIEPAYIEALKHKRDLFNYGYEKNVILVSHTTLMPILSTVANLWRMEQGNNEAKEIIERAGDIYNQVCVVAERLHKLGKSLTTVSNQYNDTVKGLVGKQGLAGKVERFASLSNKVTKTMPQLEPTHADVEVERLELIAERLTDEHPDQKENNELKIAK